MFAQETLKVEEVARELEATRAAIGSGEEVRRFVTDALRVHGAVLVDGDPVSIDVSNAPRALRELLELADATTLRARFELPAGDGVTYLSRTHPLVDGLASYVVDTALDPQLGGQAKRAGATRTNVVQTRTTLLLVRYRFDVITTRDGEEHRQVAEDAGLLAFTGAPEAAEWLDGEAAAALLDATPAGNVSPEQARDLVQRVLDAELTPRLEQAARERAAELLGAHRRVREGARITRVSYTVEPQLPADILGIYVLLPMVS
jgi:hypothetical protein